MKRDNSFINEPSKKMLVFSAAIALVACTVVLWGVIGHSGKLVRQNAELALAMSRMAPEPKWDASFKREILEKSLIAAYPNLSGAQISFAAPCWTVVHTEKGSLLLKWQAEGDSFTWTVLDEELM